MTIPPQRDNAILFVFTFIRTKEKSRRNATSVTQLLADGFTSDDYVRDYHRM